MKRYADESGQSMVEYALTFPLFLLIFLSIIEGGWIFMSYNTLANAAREGARAGVIPVSSSCNLACVDEHVATAARRLTVGLTPANLTVTVNHAAVVGSIQVEITYNHKLMTGILVANFGGNSTVPLRALSTMKLE